MRQYGIQPLYHVENPANKAMGALDSAANTYGRMEKEVKVKEPEKTMGGGMMNAAGGTLAAASIGSMMAGEAAAAAGGVAALGGPVTLGVGAGLGLLSYFLS